MARTGENIYKRKDGRWEARYIYTYDSEGKAKYRSIYGISRQEAKQKRLLKIHESMLMVEATSCTSPTITFKDLSMNWLNNAKLRVKESTFSRYSNQVKKHILPFLGKYQASKISTEQIEQLVSRLLKSKENGGQIALAPKTVEDILIIVKSILRFGKCHIHLELNRIKIKTEIKKPRIFPKPAQLRFHQFLAKDTDYIKAGILLSLHTGIRIGELCALCWQDIDFEEQVVHIDKTLQRIQISNEAFSAKTKVIITAAKSKKSIRDIPIPKFLTAILRKLKSNANNFLLTGHAKYMEPRALHYHFKKFLKQCGIADFKFHSLRHTFATNYIEAGFDMKSLSEILGHSSVKITLERYVHTSDKLKRHNMDKLVNILLYSPSNIPSSQYTQAL